MKIVLSEEFDTVAEAALFEQVLTARREGLQWEKAIKDASEKLEQNRSDLSELRTKCDAELAKYVKLCEDGGFEPIAEGGLVKYAVYDRGIPGQCYISTPLGAIDLSLDEAERLAVRLMQRVKHVKARGG